MSSRGGSRPADPTGELAWPMAKEGLLTALPEKKLPTSEFRKHFLSHCLKAPCNSPAREAWAGGGRGGLSKEKENFGLAHLLNHMTELLSMSLSHPIVSTSHSLCGRIAMAASSSKVQLCVGTGSVRPSLPQILPVWPLTEKVC